MLIWHRLPPAACGSGTLLSATATYQSVNSCASSGLRSHIAGPISYHESVRVIERIMYSSLHVMTIMSPSQGASLHAVTLTLLNCGSEPPCKSGSALTLSSFMPFPTLCRPSPCPPPPHCTLKFLHRLDCLANKPFHTPSTPPPDIFLSISQ